MIGAVAAVLVLEACGGSALSTTAPAPVIGSRARPQAMELMVVAEDRLRIVRVEPDGLRPGPVVTMPGRIEDLSWGGSDAVALVWDQERGAETPFAIVDEEVRPLDVSTVDWTTTPSQDWYERLDPPDYTVAVGVDGAVWLGRADWGYIEDDDGPRDWMYARLPLAAGPASATSPTLAPQAPLGWLAPAPQRPDTAVVVSRLAGPSELVVTAFGDDYGPLFTEGRFAEWAFPDAARRLELAVAGQALGEVTIPDEAGSPTLIGAAVFRQY
ncbi:MAG: hypothetical protein R2939_17720 [Kofleriaceae bacterium]